MSNSRFHIELDRLNALISDTDRFSKLQPSTQKYVLESRKNLRIHLGMDSNRLDEEKVLGFHDKPSRPIYYPPKQRGLSPEYSERNGYNSKSYKEFLANSK